jgi:hypothetical protein
MGTKETAVALLPTELPDAISTAQCVQIATIVSLAADGTPEVRIGAAGPIVRARFALRATRERIETAIAERQQAVVLFEGGDTTRPLIVGFIEPLQPQASTVRTDVRQAPDSRSTEAASAAADTLDTGTPTAPTDAMPAIEADVDGRRVRLTAQDEIVLECGSASVTLRRNGRVVIRGTYVETHSQGTNRIKGGQVQIN